MPLIAYSFVLMTRCSVTKRRVEDLWASGKATIDYILPKRYHSVPKQTVDGIKVSLHICPNDFRSSKVLALIYHYIFHFIAESNYADSTKTHFCTWYCKTYYDSVQSSYQGLQLISLIVFCYNTPRYLNLYERKNLVMRYFYVKNKVSFNFWY